MEVAICDVHDQCQEAFERLQEVLLKPKVDFNHALPLAAVRDEYGRFRVWRGNVGAHHEPTRRISLDYRLRDSQFYREKIVRLLQDLDETLRAAISLLLGEREPFEDLVSPSISEAASGQSSDDGINSDHDDSDDMEEDESTLPGSVSFAQLRNILHSEASSRSLKSRMPEGLSKGEGDQESVFAHNNIPNSEMVQLRESIQEIISHLYRASMVIRRPIPQDRITRSANINMKHFAPFDLGFVQDCYPRAHPELQQRLASAITRRRQILLYNRRHHHALSRPRHASQSTEGKVDAMFALESLPETPLDKQNDNIMTPKTHSLAPLTNPSLSKHGLSTQATNFEPPNLPPGQETEFLDWETGTQSSYASTLGGKDNIRIPPRPCGPDGKELTQFECPYCFRLIEIRSSKSWSKHILTDLSPYICTFNDCSKPEHTFETRSEWYNHELQSHRKQWHCNDRSHLVFQNSHDFEQHLRKEHIAWITESQLPSLIHMSERNSQASLIPCPLCTEDHKINKGGEYSIRRDPFLIPAHDFQRHLGRHQERLALFAISSAEHPGDADEGSVQSQLSNFVIDNSRSLIGDSDSLGSDENDLPIEEEEEMEQTVVLDTEDPTEDHIPLELHTSPDIYQVKLPCRTIRPYSRNAQFVGRSDIVDDINSALHPGSIEFRRYRRIFALCGSGGVGKSQTALSYVFDHMDDFQAVLWAHAGSETQLLHCLSEFASELDLIPEKEKNKSPKANAATLLRWYEDTKAPWLLIIDGADNEPFLKHYLPTGAYGSILITSRNASLVPKYGGAVLGTLDEDSAIELLLMSLGREGWHDQTTIRPAAQKIARRLGYFPMALVEAAHYISSNGRNSLADFVEEYDQNELALAIAQPGLYNHSMEAPFRLSTVWNMSFESLDKDQQDLLNMISFFDPVGIPLELIREGAAKAFECGNKSFAFVNSARKFNKCRIGLTRSSLVMQNEHLGQLWLHRLVQENCQARMSIEERRLTWNRCLAVIDTMWPAADRNDRHKIALWPEQTKYLPHIQSIAFWFHKYDGSPEQIQHDRQFAEILVQAASFCYVRGFYERVESLSALVEQYATHSTGDCELLLFENCWAKGAAYLQINKFQQACQCYEKAYELFQIALQKGNVRLPDGRQALACGLMGNGCMAMDEYEKAEEWYLKAFQIWSEMEEVPKDRLLYVSNMASCLCLQGKQEEAREILMPNISDSGDTTSFVTGDSFFIMGNIQIDLGKLSDAFESHKQACLLFKATLGDRHRLTANVFYKLGWNLHQQKKLTAAITMLEQALDAYGDNSYFRNETARTLYKLGNVQLDIGKTAEGAENIKTAVAMFKEVRPMLNASNLSEKDFDKLVISWFR